MGMKPLPEFCCGCSLYIGVPLVAFLNVVQCIFYIVTAWDNIIIGSKGHNARDTLEVQTFNAGLGVMGLPFIFAAFWGVWNSQEAAIRLYLFYFLVNFCVDFYFMFDGTFIHDPCRKLPGMFQKHGDAFACGVARLTTFAFLLLSTVMQLYFAYAIWSLAEDIKVGGENRWHFLVDNASDAKRREAYTKYTDGLFGVDKGALEGYGTVSRVGDPVDTGRRTQKPRPMEEGRDRISMT